MDLNGIRSAISKGKYQFNPVDNEEPLWDAVTIYELWPPQSFYPGQLHIYITLPADIGSPTQFWEDLWQHKVNLFHEVSVIRDLNSVDGVDVPATVKVLHLSKIHSALGDVMVRDDYDEALKAIEGYHAGDTKSVIILGHPGIGITMGSVGQALTYIYTPHLGKTILLYYILAKRLFEEKPTIFQYTAQYLFFFQCRRS